MTHQLPWHEDTRMNLSDFLQKSMSFAGAIMENQEAQSQASRHLGSLLQLQHGRPSNKGRSSAVNVLNQLFAAAEQSLETDNDRRVVGLLKTQVATFINKSLGIYEFNASSISTTTTEQDDDDDDDDDKPTLSWADVASIPDEPVHSPQPTRYHPGYGDDDDNEDDGLAERAEKLHLDNLAAQYNTYDKEDDEPDSDHEEQQQQPLSRGIQTRGGGDGFCTVQKKRYRRSEYRRQGGISCQEFRPSYLHSLPSDTYCIPIFFPSEDSYNMFHGALSMAQKTLHIAVFSLTDNKTANVLIDAKERGVDVKIVTDNDQLEGKGADVRRLNEEYGIPFKTDNSDQFMHNKFAVIDERIVITGSFNWSIGARFKNKENVIITNIPSLAHAYEEEFGRLWHELQPE
ncbi:hypothetical protein BC941DRAFT_505563 [Chlamydoabsidia padenii]|nr:hypothetical protein BC941DRAFT_505563 [Chlamydoabsidia padenii]